jgi:hypothetical protein
MKGNGQKVTPKCNLKGIEDGNLDSAQPAIRGHTKNDQKNMDRMGKRQEFIVSHFPA